MFTKLGLFSAAIAMSASAIVPATAAQAQRYDRGYEQRYDRGYDQRADRRYNNRVYRGNDGYSRSRARQKCNDGDGGTIVGAIAGGLLGRTIDNRGDRLLGTVLGAGAGALAGRAIDRSDRPNYCRR